MNYKNYHWHSYGPLFRDLHLLFDEHATAILDSIDELAERVRILRGSPLANPNLFGERGTVLIAIPAQSMRDMVAEAHKNEEMIIEEMRSAIEMANKANDPGTADLFTRLIQVHEKHEWFLRETLERSDGMVF